MWLFRLTAPFFCWSSWEGKQKQSTKNAIITQPTYRNQRSGSKIKHGKSCGCHHKIAYIYIYKCGNHFQKLRYKTVLITVELLVLIGFAEDWFKNQNSKVLSPPKDDPNMDTQIGTIFEAGNTLEKNSSIFGISMSDFFWVLYSSLF